MQRTLPRLARAAVAPRTGKPPQPKILPPWESARQPTFMSLARAAVLHALAAPGAALTSKALYAALQAANVATPDVLVPEPYAIDPRKPSGHAPAPSPPHPELAVRGMTHLKKKVLPALEAARVIKKVHRTRALTPAELAQRLAAMSKARRKTHGAALEGKLLDEWLWTIVPAASHEGRARAAQKARADAAAAAELERRPWAWQIGMGQNTDHLSRRRARAREDKVRVAAAWVGELEKARRAEDKRAAEESPDA